MARRSLRGSRIIVTGASSGIGRSLALELGRAGAKLVLNARREATLEEIAREVRSLDGQAQVVAGDVTQPEVRQAILEASQRHFGGLDALVNNAGVGAIGRFDTADPARLRQIMEVNFFAPVEMSRLALPDLKQGMQPILVAVGSILGRRGIPSVSEYCASKFALCGFYEALRAELARDGIDVLLVNPGTTETEFSGHLLEKVGNAAWSDSPGVSADYVARRIVEAMARGRHEIVPNPYGRLLLWLNRLSPRLADWLVRKFA